MSKESNFLKATVCSQGGRAGRPRGGNGCDLQESFPFVCIDLALWPGWSLTNAASNHLGDSFHRLGGKFLNLKGLY